MFFVDFYWISEYFEGIAIVFMFIDLLFGLIKKVEIGYYWVPLFIQIDNEISSKIDFITKGMTIRKFSLFII